MNELRAKTKCSSNNGFRGIRASCPATNFVGLDSDQSRNPLMLIHSAVTANAKKKTQTMKSSNEERPVLRIKLTSADKLLEVGGWIILSLLWVILILKFTNIPDTIPIHYSVTGKPDSFGNKTTIFLLPILGTILFAGMTILNNYPHVFNYPTKITNQNAERQYTIATKLIRYLKFIIVLTFSFIVFMTFQKVNDKLSGLGIWFIPVFIGLIYIPLIYAIIKLFKTT